MPHGYNTEYGSISFDELLTIDLIAISFDIVDYGYYCIDTVIAIAAESLHPSISSVTPTVSTDGGISFDEVA